VNCAAVGCYAHPDDVADFEREMRSRKHTMPLVVSMELEVEGEQST
jgi:hypothetical protein